jgi:hypothetical protein
MLQINGVPGVVKHAIVDGRTFDSMLRRSSASQRAVIADDIHTGRLVVSPLTARQSRLLATASQGYTHTASKLTDSERTAVINGQSLSAIHNKPSAFSAMARAMKAVEAELGEFESISVGDLVERALAKIDHTCLHDTLDRLTNRYPEQAMSALDRYTSPELPLVAAE